MLTKHRANMLKKSLPESSTSTSKLQVNLVPRDNVTRNALQKAGFNPLLR